MKKRHIEQYQDMISRLFPVWDTPDEFERSKHLTRTITFQVTDACNLKCSYCYQIKKGTRVMKFETAKKMIDRLLSGDGMDGYITVENSPGIIIEFIGGEPFLQVGLIDQIVNYFQMEAIRLHHPWATRFMISICSNGILHGTPEVQKFLDKNKYHMSYSITIDGNKELHDACRVFPDGSPSYDIAVAGAKDWIAKGGYMGSKITIAPQNLPYLYDAILHMIDLGYYEINANVVYEKGWEQSHATEFYHQLKHIADYFIGHDLVLTRFCSLFEENFFCPKSEEDNDNWCGGTGFMLSVDPDGYLYPCIRYMESSLGCEVAPMRIGHVDTGIGCTGDYKDCIHCLQCIDRRTQSTDECYYCPIAEGCSWCSAYNYQEFGTPDHRATYICEMHKARALANAYFWNRYYYEKEIDNVFQIHCPKEWAIPIIGEMEYGLLKNMEEKNENKSITH